MGVELISWTRPIPSLEEKGISDLTELVAYCARVSNPENQYNTETSERLIRYLIKNKHWSPFEMASITLEIKTTRDIGRQILRHKSFTFQEFSQRYMKASFTPNIREARIQDGPTRQSSKTMASEELQRIWHDKQLDIAGEARRLYEWALDSGIAKEQARVVLPEGLTPTTMYMQGTLRSWIHYIDLRTQEATQKEHRDIALECSRIIYPLFPSITEFVH